MIGGILILLMSYLIGSIPFGLVLGKIFLKKDIRDYGSGNIGATNMLRIGGKKLAMATLCLDMLKAAIPVVMGQIYMGNYAALAGVAAVLGHIYPVWLRFNGGKGVATGIGMFLVLNFSVGLTMVLVWLGVAYRYKYSSLAAIAAFTAAPVAALIMGSVITCIASLALSAVVIHKHRGNIERLIAGTESKIALGKRS